MKIDIKGFFLGGFIGLLLLVLLGAVIGFLAVLLIHSSGNELDPSDLDVNAFNLLSVSVFLGAVIGNFISGYIVAKLSNTYRLFTAIAVGLVGTVLAVIPFGAYEGTFSSLVLSGVVPLPLHYLGASYFIKRTNKFKNENASGAGTDAA